MILDDEFFTRWRPLVRKRLKRKIGDFPLEDLDDVESQVFEAFMKSVRTGAFKGRYGDASTWTFLESVIRHKCSELITYQETMRNKRAFDPGPKPHAGAINRDYPLVAHLYSDDDTHQDNWLENKKPVPFYCLRQRLKFAISWLTTYPNHVLETVEAFRAIRKDNREIIRLYREGYSREEIAAKLNMAPGQIKGRLERDKKRILKRAVFPSIQTIQKTRHENGFNK